MALKRQLFTVFSIVTVLSGAALVYEFWHWDQIGRYNKAIEQTRLADAARLGGEYGLFVKAFAEQQ